MVTAQSEQQALEAALTREARRILDGAKAELERDRSTLAMLRGKADDEKSNVFSDNEEYVRAARSAAGRAPRPPSTKPISPGHSRSANASRSTPAMSASSRARCRRRRAAGRRGR